MDCQKEINILVENLGNYLIENNLKYQVLGVSGGLDSTFVAYLCHEVFLNYQIPVHLMALPSSTNSREEKTAAILTQRAFANTSVSIDIDNSYSILSTIALINGKDDDISRGNIKARIRMIYLMDAASKLGGTVIGTDNKSEHELGFYTIFGDMGMVEPIVSLYKTEVYELAEYVRMRYKKMLTEQLNPRIKNCIDALTAAINNVPSDGNGVGTDETQIGAKYSIIDKVLQGEMIEDEELYNKILDRVHKNEFKKYIPVYL